MPIRVKCGTCKKTLSVKDHLAGKKIKCPECSNIVVVPAATGQNGSPAPQPTTSPAKKPIPAGKPSADAKNPVGETKKAAADAKKPILEAKKSALDGKKLAPETKKTSPVAPSRPLLPEGPPPENAEEEALSIFAEDLKPKVDDSAPKTIEFKCEWCDEQVSLPIDLAGKQTQCPNPECRRIVKVPLPKIEAKKDWRSMDRRGPAGALVSQPEAPKDAWGSQEAVRARQDSLVKAGAIDLPPKPSIGAAGWILRGVYFSFGLAVLVTLGAGFFTLKSTSDQHRGINELKKLVDGPEAKITQPVLAAETYRTIALMYLASQEKNRAVEAQRYFQGAQTLFSPQYDKENPGVNEQLFLIELALSQIELGSSIEDDVNQKLKRSWEDVRKDLEATLNRIQSPEVQVMAMRRIATRLLERNQANLALGLAGGLSAGTGNDAAGKQSPAFSQQIALYCLQPEQKEKSKSIPKIPEADVKDLQDAHARVGYAEGYARKQKFAEAFALAQIKGPPRDRLEANLGVATIAAADGKTKDEALKFLKEALKIVKENKDLSEETWLPFFLAQLGTRLVDPAANPEDGEALKNLIEGLPGPFKRRAHLELFLARCEKSPGPISADDETLGVVEAIDKSVDKEGVTICLAWFALAEQQARKGVKRSKIQQEFTRHAGNENLELLREKIRPILDVGAALGALR